MLLKDFIEGAIPVKSFQKGELIFRQDAHARYFYEVKEGEVIVRNSNSEGREFVQALYTAGECFGIAALINDKPYPSAAIANTSCELYLITKEHFFRLLKESFAFHLNITRIVCRQLQYKTMMLEEIANEEGEHRLLTLIHYLMARTTADNNVLDITKQQLADMTGLRVETVIKTLKKIENQGRIATRRGKIVCLSNHRPPI